MKALALAVLALGTAAVAVASPAPRGEQTDFSARFTKAPKKVQTGDKVSFQVVVTNEGPAQAGPALSFSRKDSGPMGVDSATASSGECQDAFASDSLVCRSPGIEPGQQVTYDFVVTAYTDAGSDDRYTQIAAVRPAGGGSGSADPNPSNSEATAEARVAPRVATVKGVPNKCLSRPEEVTVRINAGGGAKTKVAVFSAGEGQTRTLAKGSKSRFAVKLDPDKLHPENPDFPTLEDKHWLEVTTEIGPLTVFDDRYAFKTCPR
jgi:hypothetical protein